MTKQVEHGQQAPAAVSTESFTSSGSMGALISRFDWPQTPMGPISRWSQSLKTVVRLILGTKYPMFVWWDREALTMFHNDAYVPILGLKYPAALGQSAPLVWQEIWNVVGPMSELVFGRGESIFHEDLQLIVERDNYREETYFTLSYSPIPSDSGIILGMFCTCSEETVKVLGRRRLNTIRELSERATTEREALLASEQQGRAEAERLLERSLNADRRKDEFLAILSHELRSPLHVIGGHAELLQMETPGSLHFKESLEAIERNTKYQTHIIGDLLDISRIVTGKFLLEISSFDVATIVDDAVSTVGFAAKAKGIVISQEVEAGLGQILGDTTRIQQLVWNLLSNAVKFTPNGGRISVSVRRIEAHIEIVVADTGTGISADFLPHVFDRFNQEDASSTRKYGGLGLGLSIVRHIAELHGGTVNVDSRGRNQGAVFTVTLPLRDCGEHERRVTSRSLQAANDKPGEARFAQLRSSLQGQSILVLDDDDDSRNMISKVFHRLGGSVSLAMSAPAAFHLSPP